MKNNARLIKVVDNGTSHLEKMHHVESYAIGKENAELMKNGNGFFIVFDSNGTVVDGGEFAYSISEETANTIQALDGEERVNFIKDLKDY